MTVWLTSILCTYVCAHQAAMASRAETFNIFQLIPFIYFHFKCDFKCAHGLLNVHEELSLCLVEFDKVETAHKGISRFVSSSKRYFFHHFSFRVTKSKKNVWKSFPQLQLSWIPSIELSIFVYSLFMCVVSLSPNIFTIYMHPLFIFLSLTLSLSFQSGQINDHVDDILTLEVKKKKKNWKSM